MYRNWILPSIITLLFGASAGFVAGRVSDTAKKQVELALLDRQLQEKREGLSAIEQKAADASTTIELDRNLAASARASVRETFKSGRYSCVIGENLGEASCVDQDDARVARIESVLKTVTTDDGREGTVTDSISLVFSFEGKEKRLDLPKFWKDASVGCQFDSLDGSGSGMYGDLSCEVGHLGAFFQSYKYHFNASEIPARAILPQLECILTPKAFTGVPVTTTYSGTCKDYNNPQ